VSVTMYTGTPGAGKSYHGLSEGLMWAERKWVVANFQITNPPSNWLYVPDDEMTVPLLVAISRELSRRKVKGEAQILLVMDECGRVLNSRDFAHKDRMAWVTFFSQHRKLMYEVVLIIQNDRMLDRQVRSMVEYEVRHLAMNKWFPFSLLPVKVFLCVNRWYQTKFAGKPRLLMLIPWRANRYDHMALFTGDEGSLLAQVVAAADAAASADGGTEGGDPSAEGDAPEPAPAPVKVRTVIERYAPENPARRRAYKKGLDLVFSGAGLAVVVLAGAIFGLSHLHSAPGTQTDLAHMQLFRTPPPPSGGVRVFTSPLPIRTP
jgi:zona occludens toxin